MSTQIMATTGPELNEIEDFTWCLENNIIYFRIHLGKKRNHIQYLSNLMSASQKVGKKGYVFLDIPASRMRIGQINRLKLNEQEIVYLCFENNTCSSCIHRTLPIRGLQRYYDSIVSGNILCLKDGNVKLKILKKLESGFIAECLISRTYIISDASCYIKGLDYNIMTDEILNEIINIRKAQVNIDGFILSFSESVYEIKDIIKTLNSIWENKLLKYWAKIETRKGIYNIDEIIRSVDGIMIGRGDLKLDISTVMLPVVQKLLVERVEMMGKLISVGTQFLEMYAHSAHIHISELCDIYIALEQRVDIIMLSGESGGSKYSKKTLQFLQELIEDYEILIST